MRLTTARLGALGAVVLAALTFASAVPAVAAGEHHAIVVVEANGTVVTRVVTFSADSIGGLDALRSAGVAPLLRGFSGIGGAVCAMHVPPGGPVVGCPADATCLTCSPSSYWAYFRAPAGTTSFTWSRAGAGATRVHDGDVEGWRWGGGDPPPFPSSAVVHVAPAGPPATTPTTVPGASGPKPSAASAPSVTSGAGATATTGPAPGPGTASSPDRAPTTTTGAGDAARGAQAASHRADGSGGSGGGGPGSAIGFAVFGVVAAALAVAVVLARRARRA